MLRKILVSSAILLFAASFVPAHAALRTGESVYLLGHGTSLFGEADVSVLGLGYKLNIVPKGSTNKSWSVGFEYGQGMNSNSQTPAASTKETNELDITEFAGLLEMNHYFDCCDDAFYCGPTLYYSNESFTAKRTGNPDSKYKGISTVGIGARLGRGFALSNNVRAQGEFRDVFGYSMYSETRNGTKYEWSAWRFIPTATVGLYWSFGK